jgi:superfamily I DNA and/or RNA helicase
MGDVSGEVDRFCRSFLEFADLESGEEARQLSPLLSFSQLVRAELCLENLSTRSVCSVLSGLEVTLGPADSHDRPLPPHKFAVGDAVLVSAGLGLTAAETIRGAGRRGRGVVSHVGREAICVTLDDEDELLETAQEPYRVLMMPNDVSQRRLRDGVELLQKYSWGPAVELRRRIFGLEPPQLGPPLAPSPSSPPPASLNASQLKAVDMALRSQDWCLIHGPPGTGKTSTVAEVVRSLVGLGQRVLCVAASNVAVDNLLEKLTAVLPRGSVSLVRMGNPVRMLDSVKQRCLDALVEASDEAALAADARREASRKEAQAQKSKSWAERRALRQEMRGLFRECRDRERRAVGAIMGSAQVVLATIIGSADRNLKKQDFDVCIVDEAAQAPEAITWIAALQAKRLILAGDDRQLPPTVRSEVAARKGLGGTLFERLRAKFGDTPACTLLTTQYRMNEAIMAWSNKTFYEGKLVADAACAAWTLSDLPEVRATDVTRAPLAFVDTAGCDCEETAHDSGSKVNRGEAEVVRAYLQDELLSAGVKPSQITVITPYSAQVALLREMLLPDHPELEIGTVDGLQGREKEAVVLSLVRSNDDADVGFLSDQRRLNVATTRAKRHLAIVGNSEMGQASKFLKAFFEDLEARAEYLSAASYQNN